MYCMIETQLTKTVVQLKNDTRHFLIYKNFNFENLIRILAKRGLKCDF